MVRLGIIGTGGISRSHLANLITLPDVDVVGLCDIVPEQIETTRRVVNAEAAKQGIERRLEGIAYTDYRTMLRQERLDAVYLCLPPYAHGAPEDAVIAAGLHMLIEKPVTLDLPLANRIWEKARARHLMVASGYQLRYWPAIEQVKERLAGRTIGMAVVMRFGTTPGVEWYPFQDQCGGQFVEQATHQVDQLRCFMGEVRTVYAAAATRFPHPEAGYNIFDVNCATLTFASGAVANFANNLIATLGSPPESRGLHIMAEGLTFTQAGGPFRIVTENGTEQIPTGGDPMLYEDTAFVQAVAQNNPSFIKSDYLNGIRTLAVTIAGERSARTGRPVDVQELLAAEAPLALPATRDVRSAG